ncbi:hypothetical protein VNO77_24120 [Canavalia gladiata]|uniref:Uncharacterized protein n=1 Tax=Canavalia gladiata TaxID=3824 RepID=A0AAN9L900_CANGL
MLMFRHINVLSFLYPIFVSSSMVVTLKFSYSVGASSEANLAKSIHSLERMLNAKVAFIYYNMSKCFNLLTTFLACAKGVVPNFCFFLTRAIKQMIFSLSIDNETIDAMIEAGILIKCLPGLQPVEMVYLNSLLS